MNDFPDASNETSDATFAEFSPTGSNVGEVPIDMVLDLPMPVRRVTADARIADDVGKVAVQRGPIVYALEGVDNGGKVDWELLRTRHENRTARERDKGGPFADKGMIISSPRRPPRPPPPA